MTHEPIYHLHPSAKLDLLQSPLVLQPASPNHNPALIENYNITGVHSTNPQSEHNFYIYLYLPNDYNTTDEVLELITAQLNLLQAAGYPTSAFGMKSASVNASTNPPQDELDDDPIELAANIIPTQLSPYPHKFLMTLPSTSPDSQGLSTPPS